MTSVPLWRRATAELLGTGLLVAVVVGSGIAAQRLSPGDVGLQLLENSSATALGLAVLILIFQPVSGAHFNPVVTLADRTLGASCSVGTIVAYVAAQVIGGIGGGVLANAMFGAATALSTTERATAGHLLGEVQEGAEPVLLGVSELGDGDPVLGAADDAADGDGEQGRERVPLAVVAAGVGQISKVASDGGARPRRASPRGV